MYTNMDMILSKLWEIVKDREGWLAATHGVAKSQTDERLTNANMDILKFHHKVALGVKSLLTMQELDARQIDSIPVLGGSPGVGNGTPSQYSCLENSMGREAWQAAAHGATRVGHN